MKMVISQLEGILIELKDVAKELREVSLFNIVVFWGGIFHGVWGWMAGEKESKTRGRVLVPAGSASLLGYI